MRRLLLEHQRQGQQPGKKVRQSATIDGVDTAGPLVHMHTCHTPSPDTSETERNLGAAACRRALSGTTVTGGQPRPDDSPSVGKQRQQPRRTCRRGRGCTTKICRFAFKKRESEHAARRDRLMCSQCTYNNITIISKQLSVSSPHFPFHCRPPAANCAAQSKTVQSLVRQCSGEWQNGGSRLACPPGGRCRVARHSL